MSLSRERLAWGTGVLKKTAAVVANQEVSSEDDRELATLTSAAKANL